MKNYNFITIHGWMRNELNLSGNALQVYAIIFGFCQDEESEFSGSIKYLMDCVGISKMTVIRTLQYLTEIKLIFRREIMINNVKYVRYKINFEALNSNKGGGNKMIPGGGNKMIPNNYTLPPIGEGGGGENNKNNLFDSLSNPTPPLDSLCNRMQNTWNKFCDTVKRNTHKCRVLSPKNIKKMKQILKQAEIFRLQDSSEKELIQYIFEDIIVPVYENNDFLNGNKITKNYEKPFPLSIDYILDIEKFINMYNEKSCLQNR